MNRTRATPEHLAKVAVKNRRNALKNPYAQVKKNSTVEEVLASPLLSDPLHMADCPPISDGAVAIILAAEGKAEKLTPRPAWITGVHHASDSGIIGFRDLAEVPAVRAAAQGAYKMAGISDPLRELDVAEICETFSHQELMLYEGLGFCGPGDGGKLLDSGKTEVGGELAVNPSGGCLSADPIMCRALVRLGEAALQVMGQAEERQVPGAKRALAHGTYGECLQGNIVWTLEAD